jgi:hypothetical protein
LQRVDLNLMVAFEALMAERSVSAAAARLGVSQPAMSGMLAGCAHSSRMSCSCAQAA